MSPPPGSKVSNPLLAVLAGGGTGAIEAMIMFPTEFVKTQLQLQSKKTPMFRGPWHCTVETIRQHGPLGLYRGLSTLVIGSIPKVAVRFFTFELLKDRFKNEQGKLTVGFTFLAGLGAGTSEAIFAVTPMETIKTKLIHDQNFPNSQRKYKGLFHGVKTIVATEGLSGIYKGLFPTILKQGTNQGTRFLVFEEIKKRLIDQDGQLSVWKSLFGGATAGAVSVFVNNPLDVVKTQMQGLEASQYKNSLDCARKIITNQGLMFFYKGVTPRLMRVCGDAAVTFTVYGELVKLLSTLISHSNH
jgi:solute carrier family 25 citrate transporter 1